MCLAAIVFSNNYPEIGILPEIGTFEPRISGARIKFLHYLIVRGLKYEGPIALPGHSFVAQLAERSLHEARALGSSPGLVFVVLPIPICTKNFVFLITSFGIDRGKYCKANSIANVPWRGSGHSITPKIYPEIGTFEATHAIPELV